MAEKHTKCTVLGEKEHLEFNVEDRAYNERDKERPDIKWNKGVVPSVQDPTQPSFQLV